MSGAPGHPESEGGFPAPRGAAVPAAFPDDHLVYRLGRLASAGDTANPRGLVPEFLEACLVPPRKLGLGFDRKPLERDRPLLGPEHAEEPDKAPSALAEGEME